MIAPCPLCKRPTPVQLGENGLCYFHSKEVSKAGKSLSPVNKVSEKQSVRDRAYQKLAAAYKALNPLCQAMLPGCQKFTVDTHHKKGRGIHLLDEKYFLACCRHCHDEIGARPALALALGLSLSRLAKEESE